jgi:hypothetical protein
MFSLRFPEFSAEGNFCEADVHEGELGRVEAVLVGVCECERDGGGGESIGDEFAGQHL